MMGEGKVGEIGSNTLLMSSHQHGHGDGEVEGVVSGLVLDNPLVLGHGEPCEIHNVLGGGDEIQQLTELSLVGHLVHQLQQVNVVLLLPKVLLQELFFEEHNVNLSALATHICFLSFFFFPFFYFP